MAHLPARRTSTLSSPASDADDTYQALRDTVLHGFPARSTQRPPPIRPSQRFSRHPFCMRGLIIQNRVFYEWNQKKILDGHLPVIPRPRHLHHGFRQPLALCMRKKKRRKAFPSVSWSRFKTLQFH